MFQVNEYMRIEIRRIYDEPVEIIKSGTGLRGVVIESRLKLSSMSMKMILLRGGLTSVQS